MFFRDILLLRINELPDFIALDATDTEITDILLVIFSAGIPKLFQELLDRDLRNSGHADNGVYGVSFNQCCNNSGSLLCSELIPLHLPMSDKHMHSDLTTYII